VTPQPRRAFVLSRGELHELPEGLSGLVPTRLAPLARSQLLSPAGKARLALDYLLPASRATADESLGAFIRRRLGSEAW
jgi:oxygen-dependent protoporphyrinogen oxidase